MRTFRAEAAATEGTIGILGSTLHKQGGEQRRRLHWRVWAANAHLSGACLPPPAASPGPAACAFSLSPPGNPNGPQFWRTFPYFFGPTDLGRIGSWCFLHINGYTAAPRPRLRDARRRAVPWSAQPSASQTVKEAHTWPDLSAGVA